MSETWLEVLKLVATILAGGGLGFALAILKRKWEKQDKEDKVAKKLAELADSIDSTKSTIMSEIEKDRAENQEHRAKQSRTRILQFNDEIYRGLRHSKENFDDVIAEIDSYEDYCSKHPDFPNFKAVAAIQNIKDTYMRCLKEGDFLS